MSFLTNLFKATLNVVTIPVAVASDVLSTVEGEDANATQDKLSETINNVEDATNDLIEGDWI